MIVNDVHSMLNPTRPAEIRVVDSLETLHAGLAEAGARSLPVMVAGGRHAMGGQQFAHGGLLLDNTAMDRVLHLDRGRGLVEVEAGIQWPALVAELQACQPCSGPTARWCAVTGRRIPSCSGWWSASTVPRALFEPFFVALAGELRARRADLIYGTVRLIERDDETFLPWAGEDQACVVLNLHVLHTSEGVADAATTFRGLIDVALCFGGTYYLTYHRYATAEQVLAAHPRFLDFLREKRLRDPDERFTSDWYRHCRQLFTGGSEPTARSLRPPANESGGARVRARGPRGRRPCPRTGPARHRRAGPRRSGARARRAPSRGRRGPCGAPRARRR